MPATPSELNATSSQATGRNNGSNSIVFAAGMAAQQISLTAAADTIWQESFTEATYNGAVHEVTGFDPTADSIDLQPFADGSHVWEIVDYNGNVVVRSVSPNDAMDIHDTIVLIGLNTSQLSLGADGVLKGAGNSAHTETSTVGETSGGTGAGEEGATGSSEGGYIFGTDGDDKLQAPATGGILLAGAGNDTVCGGIGNDTLFGEAGNDEVIGGAGDDILFGGEGNDWVFGNEGHDFLDGGAGSDELNGGAGNDYITAGAGTESDKLFGGAGNDVLVGNDGADYFIADTGIDVVISGGGDDLVKLGAESEFIFWHDFEAGVDRIDAASVGAEMSDIQICATLDGTGTWIGFGGTELILEGVDAAWITEADFTFAEGETVEESCAA